ncbi:MAG: stage II sporulation protein R [Defluviitaleaceae bacterium]|nr:stage II sporulation protein R [Defluviitaleaceae bacterium]
MYKLINWYKRERKVLFASLLCGLVFTIGAGLYTRHYSYQTVDAIASQIVRFHVLPNSNSDMDQALKTTVKEEVLDKYSEMLSSASSIEEARGLLTANLGNIEEFAQNIVFREGFNHPVNVNLSESSFPTKEYGDITLPAGRYEALRIEIGSSTGANWWCVMFPPLCFVDITRSEVAPATRESLRSLLSESEFALLDNNVRENDPLVKVRFRIVEWWQDGGFEDDEIILVMGEHPAF